MAKANYFINLHTTFEFDPTIDIQNRLKMHNEQSFNKSFTKAADDWKLALA